MAYNELVKNFSKVRSFLRDFYVYGFKSRLEYEEKSPRSYDNERRRIESWLEEYMNFKHRGRKTLFISVDTRHLQHNPFFKVFKTKSFTSIDVNLHFYLLDMLRSQENLILKEIHKRLTEDYYSFFEEFEESNEHDSNTIRNKLEEYSDAGIVEIETKGNKKVYRISEDQIELKPWKDAVNFFSETALLGVIGSYILDRFKENKSYFTFKHHYILHALDSEILYQLITAINSECEVELHICKASTKKTGKEKDNTKKEAKKSAVPLKICENVQNGRHYLLAYSLELSKIHYYRIDRIKKIAVKKKYPDYKKLAVEADGYKDCFWKSSSEKDAAKCKLELIFKLSESEYFVLERLKRERCGRVEKLDESRYRYTEELCLPNECLPWLRTFIGRIDKIYCDCQETSKLFDSDLEEMMNIYGVDDDIQ